MAKGKAKEKAVEDTPKQKVVEKIGILVDLAPDDWEGKYFFRNMSCSKKGAKEGDPGYGFKWEVRYPLFEIDCTDEELQSFWYADRAKAFELAQRKLSYDQDNCMADMTDRVVAGENPEKMVDAVRKALLEESLTAPKARGGAAAETKAKAAEAKKAESDLGLPLTQVIQVVSYTKEHGCGWDEAVAALGFTPEA